jgi:hypothetical protein
LLRSAWAFDVNKTPDSNFNVFDLRISLNNLSDFGLPMGALKGLRKLLFDFVVQGVEGRLAAK